MLALHVQELDQVGLIGGKPPRRHAAAVLISVAWTAPLPSPIAQIVGLERRVSRAGRDSIDHAPGAHDDIANAVSGVVSAISGVGSAWMNLIWD